MKLGQFSASVSVGGVELSEYAPEHSADGTEATCWIPSEADQQLCITWTDDQASAQRTISGRVDVDGICCGRKAMKIRRGTQISKASRDSVSTSETTRRPLLFANQLLTDNDEYLNTPVSPDLGTIKLQLRRVNNEPSRGPRYANAWQPQILHERSKKAIGHTVQFGAEYERNNSKSFTQSRVIQKLVTFVFKYRPIGLLMAQGIAPLQATAEPRVSQADDIDLTLVGDEGEADEDYAEIKKLEARLGALKSKKKHIKREIKTEEPISKPGEIIDLT
ncbi:hypothetical protein C8R43DRAFT_403295 [Mycena crocata]|nr:hypothetical protein C8R43DRAFT_403295 [Mycena crocata]